ncbi:Flp family type IVb pilin [Ketobacter alkanivorans]|uniref:Pilus assembly protein n=1 Tax=Ketobacter alkanivorans TaxID=1917421 RepID=A0A2K9LKJ8_9GAMM|nr:pilus assembly protein [Ketobacter alkanivorans]AUM11284.1 hypothetical protein Kalk_02055 [Ketobacter alkanivorans]
MNVNISRKLSNKKSAGQGMSEYLVIVGLIAVVGIGAMGLMGGSIRQTLAAFASEMAGGNSEAIRSEASDTADDSSDAAIGNLTTYAADNDRVLPVATP